MAWFRRRSRTDGGAVVSDREARRADLAALKAFAEARTGVEAFIEPRTAVTQTTLLLVAGDGESMRRRVASAEAARDFATKKLKLPVYDTNVVGIPNRKREYDLRQAQKSSSQRSAGSASGGSATSTKPRRSQREMAAIMVLEQAAGADPLPDDPTDEALMKVYRQARAQAHPDRNGGARERWDKVEDSARALGLPD